jgi:hypothetical protein
VEPGSCVGASGQSRRHHLTKGSADINNVGSISQALYAKGNPNYDDSEASRWQAAQVSTLSVCNFVGRVLIGTFLGPCTLYLRSFETSGLIADFVRIRLRLPRVFCFCIVSALFVVSQIAVINVYDVAHLWKATALLGLAYGGLFGICPTIVMDWFGLGELRMVIRSETGKGLI